MDAQDDDDEFDFSDDGLDDLPANALDQLENTAIQATQRQLTHAAPAAYDEDDEVINLDDAPGYAYNNPSTAADLEEAPRRSQADPNQLLLRIKKVEQERARMRRELGELTARLQTKSGETDTLRRRADVAKRDYDRHISDERQTHTTEVAKLRAEIDSLKREKEQVQTDNMFNQHDLREVGMAQRPKRVMPSRAKPSASTIASPSGTPKRGQKTRGPLGDGFDDEDVVMASPSKNRDRQKAVTPRQASKRKRQVTDQSPIPLPALQLSEPRDRPKKSEPEPPTEVKIDALLLQDFRKHDRRFTLLHHLLSHRSSNGTDRVLEALTQYSFPSQPSKKLSSILYDSLATSTTSGDAHALALGICNTFLDFWKRCLEEKYYAPLFLILDALHFILAYEPAKTAAELTERAIPLIISSVDLVALPVVRAAKGDDKAVARLYSPAQRQITLEVDTMDCLELLYLIATSCVSSIRSEAISYLWQRIPSDFAIMLLNKEQPLPQITLMLRILSTSALSSSLGPIVSSDAGHDSQTNKEDALLNRLTNLFREQPKPIPYPSETTSHDRQPEEAEIWEMRLLVLSVLTQFSISEHGSTRLAQNRLCIGRLIKYLDYCITGLYKNPLGHNQQRKVDSINTAMKLIYHIATTNPGFDVKSKLVSTLGGHHAYLVAFTRLAFSEGLVLEAGIEDAVVDMAHAILDEGLSIEEGEGLVRVFSSGNSV